MSIDPVDVTTTTTFVHTSDYIDGNYMTVCLKLINNIDIRYDYE